MKMVIKPGEGISDLLFGATQDQAKDYFGEPEEISVYEDDEIAWYYWSKSFSLHFDKEDDYRLGTIEISDPNASLQGKSLIGRTKEELIEFISGTNQIITTQEEDHELNVSLITCGDMSLNFWFEDDVLTDIQWGCLVDENDSIIWPKEK